MLIALLVSASVAFARIQPVKSFESALEKVLTAPEFQSTESQIRAIELDFASRELVLQPMLEAQAMRINENRQLLNPGTLTTQPRIDTYGLTLTKPFSTGTEIAVRPSYERALTPQLSGGQRDTFDWQVSITQRLWRDGFGRSTSLRREREEAQRKQELAGALLRQGQLLLDFEVLYWDWALARRVFDLQERNVKRGREIMRWVQDRYNRAAAESTDLLQARALFTQRELQVATQQVLLTQAITRIERFVPNHSWSADPMDLDVKRAPEELLGTWRPDSLSSIEFLGYLQAKNEAQAEEARAREAREAIRPDLDLRLVYGKNAIPVDRDDEFRRSIEENNEFTSVGVVFRTSLDLTNVRRRVESARASRDAAILRREARFAENKVAWTQLKKELADLQTQVDRAHELVDIQLKKADAERERYRKGRATAFQAITFELEAAEAEITLWTLYAMKRKTEARARLFVR